MQLPAGAGGSSLPAPWWLRRRPGHAGGGWVLVPIQIHLWHSREWSQHLGEAVKCEEIQSLLKSGPAGDVASVSPRQERAGGRGQPSPRQRPCFSQNGRAIYAPCCPHEEWTPLFLSPGWYFNGRLTGNRAKGAICPFFPLKRLQKRTLAGAARFSSKAAPAGPVTKPRDLTPNTSPSPSLPFLLPSSSQ